MESGKFVYFAFARDASCCCRESFPDVQICFLTETTCPVQAILAELVAPSIFKKEGSHYYIVPARTVTGNFQGALVGKYKLSWNDDHIECLGSPICNACFLVGKLYPYTCAEHLHCQHGSKRVKNCDACVATTLQGFWKDRLDCYLGEKEKLFTVSRCSTKKNTFKCSTCLHTFNLTARDVTQCANWCAFCANKQLCEDQDCKICFDKSFASDVKSSYWDSSKNIKTPRQTLKNSHIKIWFCCEVCEHGFQMALHAVSKGKQWCAFCSNTKLCNEEKCQICFQKSFASDIKSQHWDILLNGPVTPRTIFRAANANYWFKCDICLHKFSKWVCSITVYGSWCPFCAHQKLCDNPKCSLCEGNSFQANARSIFWHQSKNVVTPREVFAKTKVKYCFTCTICSHDFNMAPNDVSLGQWCSFCSGHQRCDQPQCLTCAQSCDVCKVRKARTKTKITRTSVCFKCLSDAIARDPNEQPLIHRAKISLEIYMLAELQRQAILNGAWFISEPTKWDCPIFPTLNFKPDCIWCFDAAGEVLVMADATTLNLNSITYMLIVEMIEDSRKAHSKASRIPDENREFQMRGLVASQHLPLGVLYVTMAHSKHFTAHPDDVFFIKNDTEYEVMPLRMDAWTNRIQEVCDTLVRMVATHSNDTFFIGH